MKDHKLFAVIFMAIRTSLCTTPSNLACTKKNGCNTASAPPTDIKSVDVSLASDYYLPPGPITLSCNASGDIQDIKWLRRSSQSDGQIYQILNSTSTITVTPNNSVASIDNYLLSEYFPFTYQCIAVGPCCNNLTSSPKTVKLRQTTAEQVLCIKDVLIIIDISYSISQRELEYNIIPFLLRFVNDDRLNVQAAGSHIALMTFGQNVLLLLSFHDGNSTRRLDHTIRNLRSNNSQGFNTRTDLALKMANQLIFTKDNPLNNRPNHNDVIVIVTDGEPTGVRGVKQATVSEAKRLKNKGVTIIGIGVGQAKMETIKAISTMGESLKTSLEDVVMIADRVVTGVCKPREINNKIGELQNVTAVLKGGNLIVSWVPPTSPKSKIDRYIISWRRIDRADTVQRETTNSSSFVIHDATVDDDDDDDDETSQGSSQENEFVFHIEIRAQNQFGISDAAQYNITIQILADATTTSSTPTNLVTSAVIPAKTLVPNVTTAMPTGENPKTNTLAIVFGVTGPVLFIVVGVIAFLILLKRARRKQREQSIKEFELIHRDGVAEENITSTAPQPLNTQTEPEDVRYVDVLNDWEISPICLNVLDKKLGEGKFGLVKLGLFTSKNGDQEEVAVKMLKETARESDLSDLLTELNILKDINQDPHPNVIKLIGGCTLKGKLLVVTEFCIGGSLRSLLINSRVTDNQEASKSSYINTTLTNRQLLKLAVDIANGMVHLSAQKFVHRDLAARNILIGEDNMAKVSDFGLARDMGNAEEYIRSNQNLLPVKWMAVESLLHGHFTTASDVWSFGVLLYEIATLGGEPYKNISPYNIINHVGCGCRMEKPTHCSVEVYDIMKNCWNVNQSERPTFSEIRELLYNMLNDNEKSYINLQHVDQGLLTTMESMNHSEKDIQANQIKV